MDTNPPREAIAQYIADELDAMHEEDISSLAPEDAAAFIERARRLTATANVLLSGGSAAEVAGPWSRPSSLGALPPSSQTTQRPHAAQY